MYQALDPPAVARIMRAYAILFKVTPIVACTLQRSSLRGAFRAQALECHPDRAAVLGVSAATLTARFQRLKRAYDYLSSVLGARDRLVVFCPRATNFGEPTPRSERQVATAPSPRKIILGRYLFQKRAISLRQLSEAVAWQRAQRPLVGEIARKWGILSDEDVHEVLLACAGKGLFCDTAVAQGKMSAFHRLAILGKQSALQQPIGRFFVKTGVLGDEELERLATAARAHNAALSRSA